MNTLCILLETASTYIFYLFLFSTQWDIHGYIPSFLFLYTAFKHISISAGEDISYTFNASVIFHICMYCSLFNQCIAFTSKAAVNICVHSSVLTWANNYIQEDEF